MRRVFAALHAFDKIILGYLVAVTLLVMVFWQGIPEFGVLLADHVLVAGLVFGLVWAQERFGGRFWGLLRSWYPLLFVMLAFRELHYLVHRVNPQDADLALMAIDYKVFGVHPTVWLEQFLHPFVTEVLQVVYSSYYFIPVIVVGAFYARRNHSQFEEAMAVTLLGFFVSYIGYFLVPALGPRLTMTHLQTVPLEGYGLFEVLRVSLDNLELEMRDCFPSGHTIVSLIALRYAHAFDRRMFWVLAPVIAGLLIATVYLRYHYVVDIAAGVAVTAGVLAGGPRLVAALRGRPVPTPASTVPVPKVDAR